MEVITKWRRGQPVECICKACGRTFTSYTSRISQNGGKCCSPKCATVLAHAKLADAALPPQPPELKPQAVRAHGLINSRVKNGRMPKPTHCETCGKESKLDGHHEDYMQPGVVAWLCRSCHMKRHHAIHKESLSLISR